MFKHSCLFCSLDKIAGPEETLPELNILLGFPSERRSGEPIATILASALGIIKAVVIPQGTNDICASGLSEHIYIPYVLTHPVLMVENPGAVSSCMEFWGLHDLEGLWFVALERTTMRISIARTQLDRHDLQIEVLQSRGG